MNNLGTIIALILFSAGIVLSTARADSPSCTQIISTTDIRTSPLSCTFDNSTCGFSLSREWNRTNSYSYKSNTIKSGLENSQFVVFDRTRASTTSPSISSPELRPGTYCLSLWTYTTGIAGRLQIKTSSGYTVTEIKGTIHSGWKQHTATVNGTTPFQIEFQYILAGFLSDYVTIGIDNILIIQTAGIGSNKTEISCAPGKATSTNGTCDFNSGSCGYTIQGHFERKTGLYSYAGNVIQQGHEKSSYIVCNWDKFEVSNNNTLTSPLIKPGTYCLTFWYYVTGSSVGLSVFTTTGQSLFANISDPESTHVWTQVAVSLTEKRPFKVLFQMLRAKGFFTQLQTVGIDDIRVSFLQEKVCTKIVPEGTCTFKHGQTCGFNLDPPRWKVIRGEFLMGRPVVVHGQDDDFYALFETFNHIDKEEEGQAYDIASPMLNPGRYCLSFWYKLPNHFSNISVITSDDAGNNTIWSLEQSQKNWTEKSLQIDSDNKFQILFRSYRFSKHLGAFVGLDNIKLSKEPETWVVSSTQRLTSTLSKLPVKVSTTSVSTSSRRTTEITISSPPKRTIIRQTTLPSTVQIKTTTSPKTKSTYTSRIPIIPTSDARKRMTTFSSTVKKTYSTKNLRTSSSSALTKESNVTSTKRLSTTAIATASAYSKQTPTVGQTETSTEEHLKPKAKTTTLKNFTKKTTLKTTKVPITTSTTSPMASMTPSQGTVLTSSTSEGKTASTKSTKKARSTTQGSMTALTTINPTTSIEIKSTPIRSTIMKTKTARETIKTSTSMAETSASSKITTITNNPTTTHLSITTTDTKQSSTVHTTTTDLTPTSSVVTTVSKTMKPSTVLLSTSQKPKTSHISRTMSSTVPPAFPSTSPVMTTVSKTINPSTRMPSTAENTGTLPTVKKLSTNISPVVTSTRSQTRSSATSLPFITTSMAQKSNEASTTTSNPSTTSVVNKTFSSALISKLKTSPSIPSKARISTSPFAKTSNSELTSSPVTSTMKVVSTEMASALPFHNTTSETTVNQSNLSSLKHFEPTTISQTMNHSVSTEFPPHLEPSITTEKDTATSSLSTSSLTMYTATEDLSSTSAEVSTSTIVKPTGNDMTSLSVSSFSSGKSTVPTNTSKSASSITRAETGIMKTTSAVANNTKTAQVSQQSRQSGNGSRMGTIVGSVLGVLAAIGLILVAVFLYLKLKSKRLTNSTSVMDDDTEATFDKSSRNSNNLGLQSLGGQSLNQQYPSIDMQPENGHTDIVRDSNRSFANMINNYDYTNA